MEELWKDIIGYEGLYAISNFGNVKSYRRNIILKQETVRNGYKAVCLCDKNGRKSHKYVHILVAEAFVTNENGLPIINHKDENPTNNNANNLEWCTYTYNNTYNNVHIRRAKKQAKTVYKYDKKGDLVCTYESTQETARLEGVSSSNIASCCNGEYHTFYGFVWSYKELDKEEVMKKFALGGTSNKKNNSLSKSVDQFDLNGIFVRNYPSAQEAGRQLNISPSLVIGVCNGKHKHSHGFIFKYSNIENKIN